MNTLHFPAGMSERPVPVVVSRVADQQWHALADDVVIGRGDIWLRPDARTFLSIDSWHDSVFDRLAETMLAELPTPRVGIHHSHRWADVNEVNEAAMALFTSVGARRASSHLELEWR
jgi:hypothetical protein